MTNLYRTMAWGEWVRLHISMRLHTDQALFLCSFGLQSNQGSTFLVFTFEWIPVDAVTIKSICHTVPVAAILESGYPRDFGAVVVAEIINRILSEPSLRPYYADTCPPPAAASTPTPTPAKPTPPSCDSQQWKNN